MQIDSLLEPLLKMILILIKVRISGRLSFKTASKSVRVSMESCINPRTGQPGLLVPRVFCYDSLSTNVVYRQTYEWQKSSAKFQETLVFIFTWGCHKFKMCTTLGEAKKRFCHNFWYMIFNPRISRLWSMVFIAYLGKLETS